MTTNPFEMLMSAGDGCLRSYEDAATSIGRVDTGASLGPDGLGNLLLLRCAVGPSGAGREGMIALLHPVREGPATVQYAALLAGAAKARGGVLPTLHWMCERLDMANIPVQNSSPQRRVVEEIDTLLRDALGRTPPVLSAAAVAAAITQLDAEQGQRAALVSLSTALLLCVGGATSNAWLALPLPSELSTGPANNAGVGLWLTGTFGALAREARAIERGLAGAAAQVAADAEQIRRAYGRAAISALELHTLLSSKLVLTLPEAADMLGFTAPTAGAAMERLESLGIAGEVTGQRRLRAFVYTALVDALAP